MKTNFKKSLAVFLAVLILASVFSITTVAASYTVTYKPGEGVEGDELSVGYSLTHTVNKALYTREHYTQTGWVRETDGTVVTFGSKLKKETVVLLPLWKGDEYKLTYDPGAYGTGAAVVVNAEYGSSKSLLSAIFTREGYVQLGWSLVDGGEMTYGLGKESNPITGDLTLYPYWAKMCNITFSPGEFGVGEEVTESVESGSKFAVKDAIFKREGYSQIGWALVDGGESVYNLAQNGIVANDDMVLYPVWLKNVCDIEISTDELYFGDLCEDYATPEAKSFVVTNAGNIPVNISISGVNNFSMSRTSATLAVGASVTIVVQPHADLGIGDYSEKITITIAENDSIIETVDFEFVVSEHVFGVYKSNNDATYSADGTKTAECVKGCGAEDTITDPGSMKVYSADNNDAVGIADSYIHHRTVRFTAYGSGMDAAEDDNLTKRFRPVSWYVNDDFNGEFEDGYDVVFTHTIFGEYTLTINYVEEELDSTTGEWVETGVADTKTFDYTVGTTAEEEKEIVRPNTILNIIFGLLAQLLSLLGLG